MIAQTEKDQDRRLSLLPAAFYVIQVLNATIKIALPISASLWSSMSLGFAAILATLLIWAMPYMLKRYGGSFLIVELGTLLLFLESSLLGHVSNAVLWTKAYWVLFVSIPIALFCQSIKNERILYNSFLNASYFVILLDCLLVPYLAENSTYSMSVTMNSIPMLFVQILEALHTKRPLNIALSVIGSVFVVIFGNRGAVGCLFFFIVGLLLFYERANAKRIYIIALAATVAMLLWVNSSVILERSAVFFSNIGLSTYTIRRWLNSTMFESNSRTELFSYYWGLIRSAPWYGYGLYGNWIDAGLGPHNGLLTLMLAFGILPGGLLCALFIFLFLRALSLLKKNTPYTDILFVFCAACFSELISTGFDLEEPTLVVFLMLCISYKSKQMCSNAVVSLQEM